MAPCTSIGENMAEQKLITNPFSNYGTIVFDEEFIGRKKAIQTITERVIDTTEPGCVSIVGLPRIGKSSLVWHTLKAPQEKLLQSQKLVVWIGMGVSRNPEEFFRQIISSTTLAAAEAGILTDAINNIASKAIESGLAWIDFQFHMIRFIKSIRKTGWRLVYVIDEFDAAKTVFKESLFAYQYLRELHNNPDHRVCFVTTSRRTISEIEISAEISNLNGIFHQIYLGMFNNEESIQQFEKLSRYNIPINDELINQIKRFTGLHPYLNAAIGFQLANQWIREQALDFTDACWNSKSIFNSYYEHIVGDYLRQEKVLGKFIDMASKSASNSLAEVDEKYIMLELVKISSDDNVKIFSESFLHYLSGLDQPLNDIHIIEKGQLLASKYRILRILGTTNHSQVAEAWEESLERKVAIKCLYLSKYTTEAIAQLKNNLEREGRILADLKHSNIGVVYNIIEDPIGVVMEWIEGQSLQDLLNMKRVFEASDAIRIGIIIADALMHAHSHNIIHRDVKPSNIILNTSNEPILIDFDVARIINRETISINKEGKYDRIGTARYSAPEQFTDPEKISPAVDIFSLGMVLYEILTYETPRAFGNDPDNYDSRALPLPEQKNIPDKLYEVICQMLNQDAKVRPSAAALRAKLENCA